MMGVEFFDNDRHFQGNYISLLSTKEVYFDRRDFKALIDFEKAYCNRYWKMFEKYDTHSREQIKIFDETSEAVSYTHLDVYKRQVCHRGLKQ